MIKRAGCCTTDLRPNADTPTASVGKVAMTREHAMNRTIKRAVIVPTFAAGVVLTGVAPALAAPGGTGQTLAAQNNWGQEVKACNLTSCHPDGTSRGGYVSGQAQDSQTPGYAWEIQNLANPGNANPNGQPFQ